MWWWEDKLHRKTAHFWLAQKRRVLKLPNKFLGAGGQQFQILEVFCGLKNE